ncbi:Ni-sirohydrochlorin a,c-diamide synthase [Methanofervidicoccus sp. A16]|uniref:Ni-sirohydrochlorin a,c-diamide synthase n=1 Tax=Methanofervidicoccus sp. A16 TaxID=2607662 RepID=UPI00118CEAB2|nr:Ni-sirohydrochlorin a,c-diamide synthase [Methanofervidicoccus sp. A16]AXI25625.1 Ni-sirohydrochlorin a,c-diamide synthase [Methanofervidicoccus sp. A16]
MKNLKRVVLAGTSSMVGKTLISTGIMRALSKRYNVQPYKVGPDYIDPTYHTTATGNYSRNLDSFFMDRGQIRELFWRNSKGKDVSIIEGVRGLYEGISPYNDVGSTASISKALKSPVVLIVDARSLTRSAVAIIKGFRSFDRDVNIKGVIFNRVRGENHYRKLKDAISYYISDIEIIGGIPRDENLEVPQRHLGLIPTPEGREKIKRCIDLWGSLVEEYLDLEKLLEISDSIDFGDREDTTLWHVDKRRCTIGVAYDEVFNFYYWDTFDALRENGGNIKFFSPLRDAEVPNCDILYFGGGYPEIFAKELSGNRSMIESIRKFDGKIYGECGGLMYLSRSIDGIEMVGLLECDSIMTKEVQGLSYVIGTFLENCPIGKKDITFRAHEFHYSKVVNIRGRFAYRIERGRGIVDNMDGLLSSDGRVLGGYAHQHPVANPYFASSLVEG